MGETENGNKACKSRGLQEKNHRRGRGKIEEARVFEPRGFNTIDISTSNLQQGIDKPSAGILEPHLPEANRPKQKTKKKHGAELTQGIKK